jgi:hypothetical protein
LIRWSSSRVKEKQWLPPDGILEVPRSILPGKNEADVKAALG